MNDECTCDEKLCKHNSVLLGKNRVAYKDLVFDVAECYRLKEQKELFVHGCGTTYVSSGNGSIWTEIQDE